MQPLLDAFDNRVEGRFTAVEIGSGWGQVDCFVWSVGEAA